MYFSKTLYFEKEAIEANCHFKLQYFYDEDVFGRDCFAFINQNKIEVVNLPEEGVATEHSEDYHYDDADCLCCNRERIEKAEATRTKYLYHHKVIESSTRKIDKSGQIEEPEPIEIMSNNRIKNTKLAVDMISFLEKDV